MSNVVGIQSALIHCSTLHTHAVKHHPGAHEYTNHHVFSLSLLKPTPSTMLINAYGFLEKVLELLRHGLELTVPLGCPTSPGDLPDSASPVLGLRGPTPIPRIFLCGF